MGASAGKCGRALTSGRRSQAASRRPMQSQSSSVKSYGVPSDSMPWTCAKHYNIILTELTPIT